MNAACTTDASSQHPKRHGRRVVSHGDQVPRGVMSQPVSLSVAALVSSDSTAYDLEWPGCPVACLPRSLLCARPVLSPL